MAVPQGLYSGGGGELEQRQQACELCLGYTSGTLCTPCLGTSACKNSAPGILPPKDLLILPTEEKMVSF